MERSTKWYNYINMAVLFVTVLKFIYSYRNVAEIFYGMDILDIVILAVTVFLVHFIKAGRLYFALSGSEFGLKAYLKTYCKVTPVSVVIPFKLGEVFRMYCYGKQIGSVMKGVIIILLDRFMDTIALVTVIALIWIFNGGRMPSFVYLLLIFLIFVLLIYFVFSGVYQYWKRYLLRARATKNKLSILKMFETLNRVYQEVSGVAKGRGVILYFMSLIAWGVEIASIGLLNGLSGGGKLSQIISDYLIAAMGGKQLVQMNRFVCVSVLLLVLAYVFIKAVEMISGKRANRA